MVNFQCNFCSQIGYELVVCDGCVQKLALSIVPLKFNNLSAKDEEYIKDTLKRLESKSGVIDLKRTKKVLNDWNALVINEYNADKTNKTNLAKALFAGRCCQIALRCTAIIYLLADEKEGSLTDQWALYFVDKALHGMVVLYGDRVANNKANQRAASYHNICIIFYEYVPIIMFEECLNYVLLDVEEQGDDLKTMRSCGATKVLIKHNRYNISKHKKKF